MKVKMKIALLKSLYDFWRVAVPAAVEKGKEGKEERKKEYVNRDVKASEKSI
jgi:hypothetical protein